MRHRELRFPCDTEVVLQHERGSLRAKLINISATGARIAVGGRLPRGGMLTLCYLIVRVPSQVVWSSDSLAGLRFVQPLAPADLAALRREGGRSAAGWAGSGQHGFRELS